MMQQSVEFVICCLWDATSGQQACVSRAPDPSIEWMDVEQIEGNMNKVINTAEMNVRKQLNGLLLLS